MSITDELRTGGIHSSPSNTRHFLEEELTAIADRIDATHNEAMQREHEVGYAEGCGAGLATVALGAPEWIAQHEGEMAKQGWIRLPKDADGEYIRIGDVMEWVRYKDDDPTIVRKVSAVGAGVFFAWSDEQGRYAQYEAHAYRHHHAPTVEDVLREFALKVAGKECMTMRSDVVDEYAAKLRLAEGEDA